MTNKAEPKHYRRPPPVLRKVRLALSILATILFVTGSILCKVLGAALATQTLLPATAIQSASPPMVNLLVALTVANGVWTSFTPGRGLRNSFGGS